MFLVTARIDFECYPKKLLLFCACATVQLRNGSRARQELKMAILNYIFAWCKQSYFEPIWR